MSEYYRNIPNRRFNPTKNMHMWVMWRTAVNEILIDKYCHAPVAWVNRNSENAPSSAAGSALTRIPLSRYIRLDQELLGDQPYKGDYRVRQWYNEDALLTRQFLYYGLPRPRRLESSNDVHSSYF